MIFMVPVKPPELPEQDEADAIQMRLDGHPVKGLRRRYANFDCYMDVASIPITARAITAVETQPHF